MADDNIELNDSFERLLLQSDDEHDSDLMETIQQDESDESDSADSESTDGGSDDGSEEWSKNVQKPLRWDFDDGTAGMNMDMVMDCKEPVDYYNLFMNNELIDFIVEETNRYGPTKDSNYLPTNNMEMRKFMAIILQMGYVVLPKLDDYWSSDPAIGGKAICGGVMTRKRFYSLMRSLHFADNDNNNGSKLYKIEKFVNLFIARCQHLLVPGRDICIDESMIPFRGRLRFRMYIPSKRHKYGIKIFKLCSNNGYTYNLSIYAGKEDQPRYGSVAERVVLKLMENLLGHGRILYTDNWYTSMNLAKSLLENKTNLVGTARKNRIGFPKHVTSLKLKKGDYVAEQNGDGIMILKWKDKREVIMLSSIHDGSITERGKPAVIVDYNKGKSFNDLSDQLGSYCPYVRKTMKWYLRIFFHIITQVSIVNALHLYKLHSGKNIKIVQFKRDIVSSILQLEKPTSSGRKHQLEKEPGEGTIRKRRCTECYNKLSKEFGATIARNRASQIKTRCNFPTYARVLLNGKVGLVPRLADLNHIDLNQ
nr:piggyBac transposable element-derived protein 4-like [Hydra vulgaris]